MSPKVEVDLAGLHQLDAAGLRQDRQEVDARRLVEVDLAVDERRHRRLRIGDPDELEAIDLRHLRAGKGGRRLVARARHVIGVLQIHRLAARDPLLLGELERARAHGLGDLRVRVGQRLLLAHDDRHRGAGLAERLEHHRVRLLQHQAEALVVDRLELVGEGEQALPDGVARRPAPQRGDHVLRRDRAAVVEPQAVAQREFIGLAILADRVPADHLRVGAPVLVVPEQGVVDDHAVDAGDGLRRPERVQRAHVGVHHGPQHLLLGESGGGSDEGSGGDRRRGGPAGEKESGLAGHDAVSREAHRAVAGQPMSIRHGRAMLPGGLAARRRDAA